MTTRILVAYATKYGSTQQVAETITTILREQGLDGEIRPMHEVRMLDGYGAVVLGAALYMGRWHPDARAFLKRHRASLSTLPVAVFALGPLSMEEKQVQSARTQLTHALAKAPWLKPVTVKIFGGVIDPAKLRFPFNHMQAGDARDWTQIRAWANQLAERLHSVLQAV